MIASGFSDRPYDATGHSEAARTFLHPIEFGRTAESILTDTGVLAVEFDRVNLTTALIERIKLLQVASQDQTHDVESLQAGSQMQTRQIERLRRQIERTEQRDLAILYSLAIASCGALVVFAIASWLR